MVPAQPKIALTPLKLVAIDIQRTMKDAEHIDVASVFDKLCDAVVAVQQYSNVSL